MISLAKFLEREVLLEPRFGISLNNKEVDEEMRKFVTEVTVEDEDGMIPQATISITDKDRLWLNDKLIVKGTGVRIGIGHRKHYKRIFTGVISHIEGDFPVEGYPTLNIYCSDIAHKLTISRKARTFKKKKVSDVIKTMHSEAGVKVIVDDTKIVLPHIAQEEESNIDFIVRWQKKYGWKYYKINHDTYYFGAKLRNTKATETLSYNTGGHEIISFKPVFIDVEKDEEIEKKQVDNKTGKVVSSKNTVKKAKKTTTSPVGKAVVKSK